MRRYARLVLDHASFVLPSVGGRCEGRGGGWDGEPPLLSSAQCPVLTLRVVLSSYARATRCPVRTLTRVRY
eukprot:2590437-Rhodomonas_salina.1